MRTTGSVTLWALAFGALLMGCRTSENRAGMRPIEGVRNASIHVLFDTTRALPVSGTFGWGISMLRVDPSHHVLLSDVEARLHGALLNQLPAEGFTYTNRAPDYLVGFAFLSGASLDEKELNDAYGNLLVFPDRTDAAASLNYASGVLILDIIERASGRLLWRGAIKADVDLDLSDDRKQVRCDAAVCELLRHYPVPSRPR